MNIKVPRIDWKSFLIPLILLACVVLAMMFGGVLRFIFVSLATLVGGLLIAGFFTVVLSDQEDVRLLGGGIAVLIPLTLVLWLLLGNGWLVFFLPYTGGLTALLFVLEARRRATSPEPPKKPD
jgi:hypothetical protein